MIRILNALLLSSILILSGCIQFSQTKVASLDEIDTLLSNQQYDKALHAAQARKAKKPSPEINNRINAIKSQAQRYDEDTSKAIYSLIHKQKTAEAKQTLSQALANHPKGKRLNKINSYLRSSESTQISRLQAQQLLAKSEWLLRAKEIQGSLDTIKPENNGTFTDPSADIEETAAELYHLGLKALQKNDLELADSCLTMSNKLHSLPFTVSAIARLEVLRQEQRQRELALQQEAAKQQQMIEIIEKTEPREEQKPKKQRQMKQLEFDTLHYNTMTMLKDNQLSSAKTNLDKLNKSMPDNEKVKQLNKEFNKKLPGHVEALLNRGRQLYINGKIEQARNIWIKARKLDPKNEEINKNIERADRVLGRLDELKKKGGQ